MKMMIIGIFTALIGCKSKATQNELPSRRYMDITANGEFWDSIDVTGLEKGVDFYPAGGLYRIIWQGEDSIDLVLKDGLLWIRDTLVAFYWYNVDPNNLFRPNRIVSIVAGDEVLPQLTKFPHLAHLYLGQVKGPMDWVEESPEGDVSIKPPVKDYSYLKELDSLRSLDVSGAVVSDEEPTHISQMAQLRELVISHSPFLSFAGKELSPAGLSLLAGLDSLRILVLSDMWNLNRSDSFRYLSVVSNIHNLQTLTLDGTGNITDDDLKYLANLTELRQLRISTCWGLKGTGFRHLRKCRKLEYIDLEFCYYIRPGFLKGPVPFNLKSIRNLGFRNCSIGEKEFKNLMGMTQLEKLNLVNSDLSSEQISDLRQALSECEITH
ncbi:hypothetical protein JXM67_13620 [candidate division WOR-3 bacterium]|nr:hypothetical protein [candidate division WOR-3 bacterium]